VKDTLEFIIIGAQKAGTTSLFEYMRRHPQLSLPEGKEAPYFSSGASRQTWQSYLRSAFAGADPSAKWGTATPQYMVGGLLDEPNPARSGERHDERTVPLRIHERVPDARLIAILRDPAERARSHHRMATMERIERRSFADAVQALLQPAALEAARREPRENTGYVVWGEYGRILGGYLAVFPPERLLVVYTADLERDAAAVLRRIFDFLEVQPDFAPENLGTRYREGAASRRLGWIGTYAPLSPWAIQRAATRAAPLRRLWHALPETRRRQIDNAFGSRAYRLDLWNRREQSPGTAEEGEERALEQLREHFAEDHERLIALLGTAPPWRVGARAG
jgi:hypothetical protein